MIAHNLISSTLPALKPTDDAMKAMDLMEEFKVSALAVVEDEKFLGIIREEILLQALDDSVAIKELQMDMLNVTINQSAHVLDVLKNLLEAGVGISVVIKNEDDYIGTISYNNIIAHFKEFSAFRSPGGIIVLQVKQNDYSLTEIGRIIEANGGKILISYIQNASDSAEALFLTVKLNIEELNPIIAALQRFDYNIVTSFHKDEAESNDRERLEQLFKFINI